MIEENLKGECLGKDKLSEMESYRRDMEKERESFGFIEVEFRVDMRAAEASYKEERRINKDFVRSCRLSFNQWLDIKKFEAAKFYAKHSDFNI